MASAWSQPEERGGTRSSPARLAVLGLLVESPAHPYEVALRFNRRVGSGWGIHRSQIYQTVYGLEDDGLVERADPTGGDKSRKVFRATRSGREVFDAWLVSEPATDPPPVRNSLFIRLAFLRPEHVPRVLKMVAAREQVVLRSIQEYSEACPDFGPAEEGTDWPSLGLQLILDGTVATLQGELRWLRRVRGMLEPLEPTRADAAAG